MPWPLGASEVMKAGSDRKTVAGHQGSRGQSVSPLGGGLGKERSYPISDVFRIAAPQRGSFLGTRFVL